MARRCPSAEPSAFPAIDPPPKQATETAVTLFSPDQWLIVALVFLLGLVLGMALMAGGKWKRRYKEERARADAAEAENRRLQKEAGEMDALRGAAARDEARRRTDGPGPL